MKRKDREIYMLLRKSLEKDELAKLDLELKKNIGGINHFGGFKIHNPLGIEVKTKNYGWKGSFKMFIVFVSFIYAGDMFISLLFGNSMGDVWSWIFLCRAAFRTMNEMKQWHAAEHKLINLLQNSIENEVSLNMENLRNSPMETDGCSGNNRWLIEPSGKKLVEALEVGREYLKKIKEPNLFF